MSDTQAYRQFGNAVTVDVAYNVAMQIVRALNITLEINMHYFFLIINIYTFANPAWGQHQMSEIIFHLYYFKG